MNAGNLSVSVEADMKALEASLAKMEAMFVESGKRAAVAFQQATGQIQQAPTDITQGASKIAEEFKAASVAAAEEFKKAGKAAGEAFREQMAREIKQIPKVVEASVATTVEATGKKGGGKAGFDFGDQFGKRGASMLKNFAAPLMAASLANTLAGIIRSEKPLNEAILDGIKTIPFVGAFANLGHAIYEATFGAADKAAEELVKKQEEARAEMLRASTERESGVRQSQDRVFALALEKDSLELQKQVNEVRKTGDAEAIARAEHQMFLDKQDLETALMMGKDVPDAEFNAFLRVQNLKRDLRQQEFDMQLDAIEKQRKAEEDALNEKQEAEAEAIKERTEKEAEALQKQNANEKRQLIKDVMKFEADQEKEVERLEQERLSAIEQADKESRSSARVGSVDTAIGEFKFSAYSDAERKKNDESTVEALRRIVSGIEEQIKITKEAVFS
jgi:hypothetical protein